MLFSELKRHIRAGQLHPAYIVTGEDAFLRLSAVNMFRALSGDMPDFNLCELVSPESATVITDACNALPLMNPRRVVLVSSCKTDLAGVEKYLDSPSPTTVLVFICEKPDATFSKILKKLTVVDCAKLDRSTIMSWIAMRTKENGSSITQPAASLLIDYCALDMARISAELDKLCAYQYDGVIEENDVSKLTSATLDFKIYELSEAVATKQAKKAAQILQSLSESGAAPVALLGMLYAHFRRLLYVSVTPSYERMASDLGVKEFAVKKAQQQAARFSARRLKAICDSLHKADYDFKTGKINDQTALELVVLRALDA
ncbi:MAG: DNA polymerase III subunit delta [Clostridiales bacterium]|nr:DNA polymerase III subunit delta [Clostridiales bacterium]